MHWKRWFILYCSCYQANENSKQATAEDVAKSLQLRTHSKVSMFKVKAYCLRDASKRQRATFTINMCRNILLFTSLSQYSSLTCLWYISWNKLEKDPILVPGNRKEAFPPQFEKHLFFLFPPKQSIYYLTDLLSWPSGSMDVLTGKDLRINKNRACSRVLDQNDLWCEKKQTNKQTEMLR